MKIVIIPLVIVALLILAAGGYFVLRAVDFDEPPSPPPAPTTPTQPPAEVEPAPPPPASTPGDSLTDFQQAVAEVAETGESQEVVLTFTEAEVNARADEVMTGMEVPEDIPLELNSVSIDLKPGNRLLALADTTILGFDATLEVDAVISIRDGQPDVSINEISFGTIPVPGSVKEEIAELIRQQIDRVLLDLAGSAAGSGVELDFQDITTDEDKLTVTVLISQQE